MAGLADVKNPFAQRKKNRFLSRIGALHLSLRNALAARPVVHPGGPVVCLTTFGARIATVHLAIESIGRGALRPYRLILWLDERERVRPLPPQLLRLMRRGLEIRYCEDIGPHKKYHPYVSSEPVLDQPLVTADDDVLYPRHWLRRLMAAHATQPELIHCFRAKRIALVDGDIAPYDDWPDCPDTRASHLNFATGVSGVVYPPRFQAALKAAGDAFKTLCPTADDIWLHATALRHRIKVRQVECRSVHFVEIAGTQASSLNRLNVTGGRNDAQIRAVYGPHDRQLLAGEAAAPAPTQ